MDPLLELLYARDGDADGRAQPDVLPAGYPSRLSTLSISALTTTEPEALDHDAQSLMRSLQALSKRSYRSINASSEAFKTVQHALPKVSVSAEELRSSLPSLETSATAFSDRYSKPLENPALDRRRKAMRLNDSIDRVSNILELPTLLQSTISASAGATSTAASQSSASANASYASALDLHAHIKRLQKLYPDSQLIHSIALQSEEAMRSMTTRLISTLRSQNLKLAAAMRLIGLLRRVAPELEDNASASSSSATWNSASSEGSLGALFLACRLANLHATLDALEPLKDLADQETTSRQNVKTQVDEQNKWAAGQQTERFLKRYIEVFREQCFAIVSMHKSIFPNSLQGPMGDGQASEEPVSLPMSPTFKKRESMGKITMADTQQQQKLPSALSTFAFGLVDTLVDTLKRYMPNVRDQSSRDSLLTQFLYCAGSLGRLGGDFSLVLASLGDEMEEDEESAVEWIEAMKRHRVQAGRLELLASGVGANKPGKMPGEITSSA